MNWLDELMTTIELLQGAIFMGILVGAVCPLIGAYFVLRRIVFLGVTLPQVSAVGVAFAFLIQGFGWFGLSPSHDHEPGWVPLAGSTFFTLAGILVIARMERRSDGRIDAGIGMIYALAAAWSILLLAKAPVAGAGMLNLLKGEIIAVSPFQAVSTAVVFAFVVASVVLFHREFLLISYDRDLAISLKKNVALWDLVFYLTVGLLVSVAVLGVGPIMTFGYLIIPPMVAHLLVRGISRFMVLASVVGVGSSIISFFVSYHLDLPLGPTSVAVLGFVYLAAWLFAAGRSAKLGKWRRASISGAIPGDSDFGKR